MRKSLAKVCGQRPANKFVQCVLDALKLSSESLEKHSHSESKIRSAEGEGANKTISSA